MINLPVLLLSAILLSGCANNQLVTENGSNTNLGYFSDALTCNQSTTQKTKINVPTGGVQTVIEMPIGYDANTFVDCMKHEGWPVTHADPTEYLKVSTDCLQKTQGTENMDENYAACVKRSRMNVDVITDK
ncbi:hypothetical protein [Methylobacter psychrophilus]|uniref:hypothetical protein n=1 Tax=Methylobacter psychrophilus TaxID=96941 RepID=UPI0021D49372|nr:hypothetical protein [Methylobacter psychrophilus]